MTHSVSMQSQKTSSAVAAETVGFTNCLAEARRDLSRLTTITTDGNRSIAALMAKVTDIRHTLGKSDHLKSLQLSQMMLLFYGQKYYTDLWHVNKINVRNITKECRTKVNLCRRFRSDCSNYQYSHWVQFKEVCYNSLLVPHEVTGLSYNEQEQKKLLPWLPELTNHVWWAADNCEDNPDKLVEMVQSMSHHVVDRHRGFDGHRHFSRCQHGPIDR